MAVIKNIIFDLGGVLLNIDYNKTFTAFKALGVENIEQMYGQHHASELFEKLETGKIREEDFYATVKKYIPREVSDEQVEEAWDAMILDLRMESLQALEALTKNHRLFLLSNTNSIHMKRLLQVIARDTGKASLDGYFSRSWYSHFIGLRKPGKAIYEFVLQEENLKEEETFFIDDTEENITTAKEMGIKTHLLLPGERIENLRF